MNWDGPADDLHKDFARSLGIRFKPKVTERELGLLVIGRRSDRPPTEKEYRFAVHLGIEFEYCTIKRWELGRELDGVIAERSKAILRQNKRVAVGTVLTYRGDEYNITVIDRSKWKVKIAPAVKGRGKVKHIYILTVDDILNGRDTPYLNHD